MLVGHQPGSHHIVILLDGTHSHRDRVVGLVQRCAAPETRGHGATPSLTRRQQCVHGRRGALATYTTSSIGTDRTVSPGATSRSARTPVPMAAKRFNPTLGAFPV